MRRYGIGERGSRRKKGTSPIGRQLIKASLEFTTSATRRGGPGSVGHQRSRSKHHRGFTIWQAAVDRREEAAHHVVDPGAVQRSSMRCDATRRDGDAWQKAA